MLLFDENLAAQLVTDLATRIQRLGGLLEERRAARLARRQLDRRGHRGVVHAFEQNDPTAVVDDRDDARPVVALRLGLGRRHHLPSCCQAQRFPLAIGAEVNETPITPRRGMAAIARVGDGMMKG
jgi:hypothetical protein